MLTKLADERDEIELEAWHAWIHTGDGLIVEKDVAGDMYTSDSEWVWRVRASVAPILDDPRRLADFPLIKMKRWWMHMQPPVSRMSMREITDALFGLEWALCSDMFHTNRQQAWFDQFVDLFVLVRNRLFCLYTQDHDAEVLDVKEYAAYPTKKAQKAEVQYDYDSDTESRAPPRKRMKDTSRRAVCTVNDDWIHDVNTAMRAIEDALFTRHKLVHDLIPIPKDPRVKAQRDRDVEEVHHVKDNTVLNYRRKWYYDLVVTASHLRVHRRRFPFDRRSDGKAVLVKKSEELVEEGQPESMEDIVVPPLSSAIARMNSDALMFFLSASKPTDDFVSKVWVGNLSWRTLPSVDGAPKIGRLPAQEVYVLFAKGKTYSATSFVSAWVFMQTL